MNADSLPTKDFERNREGRLSSRQWLELTTEPLTTLLLLSVPLILLAGRFGLAGRVIVLALVAGFGLTILLRAIRFARVRLCYRILFAEQWHPRWMFWRKATLMSKSGEPIRFHHRISGKFQTAPNQALQVYYIDMNGRRVLISMIPQKHPKASLAEPTENFARCGGRVYVD